MIPWDRIQGQTAVIVAVIALGVVWCVIWAALSVEKKFQSRNSDEH